MSPAVKRLLLPAALLLFSGISVWWARPAFREATGRISQVPANPPVYFPQPLAAQAAAKSQPAPHVRQDRFAGHPVLAMSESVQTVAGTVQVKRTRLIRDENFKHPVIRIEDELVREGKNEKLVRQVAMVGDHVLVKPVSPDMPPEKLLAHLEQEGAFVRKRLSGSGTLLIAIPKPELDSIPRLTAALNGLDALVRYAEPDFIVSANALYPNDTFFPQSWGLHNTGQSGGTPDADIDAPEAWALHTGSRTVKVAILDTGLDHAHPDLAANIWTNPLEIPGNGVDDDRNGYIDDVRGWDFLEEDAIAQDLHGHGTHCAGIAGAAGNNTAGMAGVCWQVSLIPLRFLNASGNGTSADAAEGIAYAISKGVSVCSTSWTSTAYSQVLKDAVDAAASADMLVVSAAGNHGSHVELYPEYPAAYDCPNLISVVATGQDDTLAAFSNYGPVSADLAAPGQDIYSTLPGGTYGYKSGTSMASPHVAGACALLKSYRPALSMSTIRDLVLKSAAPLPALNGKTATSARLNLHSALLAADDLLISPATLSLANGPEGGPFTPAQASFNLSNVSSNTIPWSVSSDCPWVDLSTGGGSLAAQSTLGVQVSPNTHALVLPAGNHLATLTFRNETTGRTQQRTYALQITGATPYRFDLDSDPGWERNGEWSHGVPLGGGGGTNGRPDPAAAHTGTKVFGINLAGDYSTEPGTPQYLTTGPLDFSRFRNVRLQFRRWLNVDVYHWVRASVQISSNGGPWMTLWSNEGLPPSDTAWQWQDLEIAGVADSQPEVRIRWMHHVTQSGAYPYSGWNLDDIQFKADPLPSLNLELPESVTEGGLAQTAKLHIYPAPLQPFTVILTASPDGQQEVSIPAGLAVAAGQTKVLFDVIPLQDNIADGTQHILLAASADGYAAAATGLPVHDDEQGSLQLLLPATVAEGGSSAAGQAQVRLAAPAMADITVLLESDRPGRLQVPASVVIPTGQSAAAFVLTSPEDDWISGTETATVTATVVNWPQAQGVVQVTDNEERRLTVNLPVRLLEGTGHHPGAGQIQASGRLPAGLTVALASNQPGHLLVPEAVTIPPGESSAVFDLQVPDNSANDGEVSAAITASHEGFIQGMARVTVTDDEAPALPAQPVPADGAAPVSPDTTLAWSFDSESGGIPESYQVFFGTLPEPADYLGSTDTPAWTLPLPRLASATTYYWRVVARRGGTSRAGPVWMFQTPRVGPLHHFAWDEVPAAAAKGVPFPVRITAVDEFGISLEQYGGMPALTGTDRHCHTSRHPHRRRQPALGISAGCRS